MPKKTTHPLITEILLGMSVEKVIQEHFSGYKLSDFARKHLPRLIGEIIKLDNKALRFAVRLELDKSSQEPVVRLMSYTCQSDITLTYESEVPRSPQPDCVILNDIVRRLYGINRKDPKATHTQGFVKVPAVSRTCPRCGKGKCQRYEQRLTANNYLAIYKISICPKCNGLASEGFGRSDPAPTPRSP